MIKLSLPKNPYWIDLPHGVRLYVRPLTMAVYEAARAKGSRLVADILQDHAEITMAGGTVEGLPDLNDEDARAGLSQFLFAQALAAAAIIRWEGVLSEDGDPMEVTEQSVADLMRYHDMAEGFLVKYTRSHAEAVSEGNASRPSPNGTTAAGRNIAEGAGSKDSPAPAGA